MTPRRTIIVEAPSCPRCGSIRLRSDGGTHYRCDGFGERIERYVKCGSCHDRFKVLAEKSPILEGAG